MLHALRGVLTACRTGDEQRPAGLRTAAAALRPPRAPLEAATGAWSVHEEGQAAIMHCELLHGVWVKEALALRRELVRSRQTLAQMRAWLAADGGNAHQGAVTEGAD